MELITVFVGIFFIAAIMLISKHLYGWFIAEFGWHKYIAVAATIGVFVVVVGFLAYWDNERAEGVDKAIQESYEQGYSDAQNKYENEAPSRSEIYDIVYDILIEDGKYSEDEAVSTSEFIMDCLDEAYRTE